MSNDEKRGNWRRTAGVGALLAGGALAGALFVGIATGANADTGTAAPSASTAAPGGPAGGTRDESKSQRSDESLLSGTDAEKVTAAALAKYPGATIQRVETDSDGVYEAHLTTADGQRATVEVGADFAVTGNEAGGPRNGG